MGRDVAAQQYTMSRQTSLLFFVLASCATGVLNFGSTAWRLELGFDLPRLVREGQTGKGWKKGGNDKTMFQRGDVAAQGPVLKKLGRLCWSKSGLRELGPG